MPRSQELNSEQQVFATAVRVFCTDDQPAFRRVLGEVVAATPGMVQVGEAACGNETIAALEVLRPDMLLMDVRMPKLDGFATAQALVERHRDLVVVLASAEPTELPPWFVGCRCDVTLIPKQDLCPRVLLDAWHGRRIRGAPLRPSTPHCRRAGA